MELLTNIRWLIYRKISNISKATFIIIFFMFIPYIPLIMVLSVIATPMSLSEYNIMTEVAMMSGIVILIISGTALWVYGKFYWKDI